LWSYLILRSDGAPILSYKIENAPAERQEFPASGSKYVLRITYELPKGPKALSENKPVTLYARWFYDDLAVNFCHLSDGGLEAVQQTEVCTWEPGDGLVESMPVIPTEHFSLLPGESWTTVEGFIEERPARLPKAGETYTHQYTDIVLPWWAWGTVEVSIAVCWFYFTDEGFLLGQKGSGYSLV
jgi:hypothetical protein